MFSGIGRGVRESQLRESARSGRNAAQQQQRTEFDTPIRLREPRGPRSNIVVRAHNSPAGDARFAAMGRRRTELNPGQLCREPPGARLATIGFGMHAGTVPAAHDWGEPSLLRGACAFQIGSARRPGGRTTPMGGATGGARTVRARRPSISNAARCGWCSRRSTGCRRRPAAARRRRDSRSGHG